MDRGAVVSRFNYARTYMPGANVNHTFATLTPAKGGLALSSSYDRAFVAALKLAIPAEARRWDPDGKVWLIAPSYAGQVADLCKTYLGVDVEAPAVNSAAKVKTRLIKVEYLGATKGRGNGEASAYGYVDGGWNAIFPETVLRQWFEGTVGMPDRPDTARTLYQQFGTQQTATETEIRSAYRRLARQWHPDVCTEPDAATVFKQIQAAYEVLTDTAKRRKYDAGLALAATVQTPRLETWGRNREFSYTMAGGYRPMLRCGWLLCEGTEVLGRFVVSKVLQWEDVLSSDGKVMVTSWPNGADHFEVKWS